MAVGGDGGAAAVSFSVSRVSGRRAYLVDSRRNAGEKEDDFFFLRK